MSIKSNDVPASNAATPKKKRSTERTTMTGLEMKYFVLNPNKDDPYAVASRAAIATYADSIQGHNQQLALDLKNWMRSLLNEASKKPS